MEGQTLRNEAANERGRFTHLRVHGLKAKALSAGEKLELGNFSWRRNKRSTRSSDFIA